MRPKYVSFTVSRLALYTALLLERRKSAIGKMFFGRGWDVLLAVKKVTDIVR